MQSKGQHEEVCIVWPEVRKHIIAHMELLAAIYKGHKGHDGPGHRLCSCRSLMVNRGPHIRSEPPCSELCAARHEGGAPWVSQLCNYEAWMRQATWMVPLAHKHLNIHKLFLIGVARRTRERQYMEEMLFTHNSHLYRHRLQSDLMQPSPDNELIEQDVTV